MKNQVDRDRALVIEAVRMWLEQQARAPNFKLPEGEPTAFDILKSDGALERLMEKNIAILAKDSSSRRALQDWVFFFKLYLQLHFPASEPYFREPLSFLNSVLDQIDKGSLHPILMNSAHNRAPDSVSKNTFKICCVVAGDLIYEDHTQPGKHRAGISRQEADDRVVRKVRVSAGKARIALGKTTIEGWRRQIRKAHPEEPLSVGYQTFRDFGSHMFEGQWA